MRCGQRQVARSRKERRNMLGFRTALISCIALGGMTLPALAADGPVTVVGRAAPGLVMPVHAKAPSNRLVQINSFHRDAVGVIVKDDAMSPELVQLQMGQTPIYIDPDHDYIRREGGLDQGHSIMRAMRAHRAMNAQDTAYVIRREAMQPVVQDSMIMPRAILIRPDYMERRENITPMQPEAVPVPKAPKVKSGPVALAD